MSYRRKIAPEKFPAGGVLTSQLIGIGVRLQGAPTKNANIEDVIFASALEGLQGDLRVLSLLVDWIDVHYERILVDRLFRLVSDCADKRVLAFWSAIGLWKKHDRRYLRLGKVYKKPRVDLLERGSEFYISRSGEDLRFAGSPLRVPQGAGLRHRPSDIMSPAELARWHLPYYYRLVIGPTYRADMWAELELNSELSPSELARRCYGSFATAWQVKQEWKILKEAA